MGLTPWEFVQAFGRHLPGGGIGEDEEAQSLEFFQRWMVSGQIEANCLSCHDAEPFHDQAEYAVQIARQNFRWAAAASSGFAHVSGSAKKMPDTYDIYFGAILDDPSLIPPSVSYDESRFNPKGKVFFDIKRDIPPERCYFCHSTKVLDKANPERWTLDKDVHLAAGMTCVDCHRNGLDHAIIRGYEGEAQAPAGLFKGEMTCSGCHLGEASDATPRAGRLGAPRPRHTGIPTLHFDKLTCTACHSGPWAAPETRRVKTSRAHALGTIGVNKSDGVLPHIMAPVFARQADGRIAPHNLFWPAFWARLKGKSVSPMAPEAVRRVAGGILTSDQLSPSGDWPTLTAEQVAGVLELLSAQQSDEGVPGYVSGGKLYRRADSGKLTAEEHPAARPYSWAFAHDVRPAAQSLGVRGCRDCHATDAPFLLGKVEVDAPFTVGRDSVKTMTAFLDLGSVYPRIFAFSFVFRPWMKAVTLLSALACFGVLAVTGFGPSLIVGERPAGYLLMLHVTAAPIFAVSLAVLTLMWAYRCRFDQSDWRWLLRFLRREVGDKKPAPERSGFGPKVFFWLLVIFALSVILSITLSMFPLFGTQGQEFLSQLHRYSALLLVMATVAHTYLLLLCYKI